MPSSGQWGQYLYMLQKKYTKHCKKVTFNLQNESFISPSVTSTKLPSLC